MLRYIINPFLSIILSVAMLHHVVANDKRSRTTIWPTTCYLGVDLAKICVGWYQKSGPAYEINGSLDFGPILFDADYGFGKIQRDGRKHKGSFSLARGPYFRIGLGYNFLTPTPHHNQFFIGCRYARSFFDFELKSDKLQCDHPPTDDCSKQCTPPLAHFGHRAGDTIVHWWEIVAGGKVSLISLLSIGCTVRYKFRKKIENNLSTLPFDIPGFGLGEFDHAFGYSGYVLLRIPLRKSNSASYPPLMQKSGA